MNLLARSSANVSGRATVFLSITLLAMFSLSNIPKTLKSGLVSQTGQDETLGGMRERSLLDGGVESFLGNDQPTQQFHRAGKDGLHTSSKTPHCPTRLPPMGNGCRVGTAEESRLAQYLQYLPNIQGWMDRIHVGLLANITRMQHQECIQGAVGEIGTHHGKFFYAILSSALPREPKLAVDLYEEQGRNYDMSGGHESGKLAVFRNHSAQLGYRSSDLNLMSRDSTTLSLATLADMGLPAFRIFSVDGGHSFDVTMNDMALAACAIHEKGVFVVDDVGNRDWVGVLDALVTFTRTHPGVAPFLWTCNKMYFTTVESHRHYLSWARGHPCLRCSSNIPNAFGISPHNSSYSIGGWEMCVSMDLDCQCIK